MEFKKFKVTDECIGCMACVGIVESVFQMNEDGKAFVIKQPESKDEEQLALEAQEACPVGAIIQIKEPKQEKTKVKPILADDNVKETLDKYPDLKTVLAQLSPKFKRLQNPVLYNTLAKLVSFREAAKITGVSLCVILHSINKYLGTEQELYKIMPECIKLAEPQKEEAIDYGEPITWTEPLDRYILTEETQDALLEKVANLPPGKSIVVISVFPPHLLIKMAKGKGFKFNLEKGREYRLSIYNPTTYKTEEWQKYKDTFEVLDVRFMDDPFETIINKARSIEEGNGFVLIQKFVPTPMIKMLEELGFEHLVEQEQDKVKVYFYKTPKKKAESHITLSKKQEIVLQSATPVAYPLIAKLLQSERILKKVSIKELKVWSETEKHLGWIVNGKADISFSAVLTSNKLKDLDIKFPAVVVWDNFVLITRGYVAEDFYDIIGHEIYLPLFMDAPPAKITHFLIKASGLDPDMFTFKFGNPFGRPEQIYQDLILGKIDTAVLREPEASFAIKTLEDQKVVFSEIKYAELWNKISPGFGNFPNAGVVFKGEFMRKYPEIVDIFLEELKNAITWIKDNPQQAAQISTDLMKQPEDKVIKFLQRVTFKYLEGEELKSKMKQFFTLLKEHDILQVDINDKFLALFSR